MAKIQDEGSARPARKIHNLFDLHEALGDGNEFPSDYIKLVQEEHALAVAAYHRPGSLLHGRLRPTMFQTRDYRIFWQGAERVFETAGFKALTPETIGAAMISVHPGVTFSDFVRVLASTEPVDAVYIEREYVIAKVARHELIRFQDKTRKLNDAAQVTPTKEVFVEYISAAQELGRTPGAGAHLESVGEKMAAWDPTDAADRIVPSGLDTIDGVSGGGPGKGDLVVIGAGTNAGKSYLGEQLLFSHSTLSQPFLYVSVEDDEDLMRCRILARHTNPRQRPVWIRKKPTKPDELAAYDAKAISDAKILVAKDRHMFIARKRKGRTIDIIDIIRRYRYEKGVVAVMVDYLQAITADNPAKGAPNLVQETAQKVSQLKEAADSLGLPIYLTSQLTREGYKDGTEPEMNHVKYAGDIENEAEIVALLWRNADQTLNAKIAKAKWVETKTPRYIIRCDSVTGVFGRWEPAFQDGQGQAGGNAPPGGQQRGGRGQRRAGPGPRL